MPCRTGSVNLGSAFVIGAEVFCATVGRMAAAIGISRDRYSLTDAARKAIRTPCDASLSP